MLYRHSDSGRFRVSAIRKIFTLAVHFGNGFTFGLLAAVSFIFIIVGEFITIIGIPCGLVWAKSFKTIFNPVDKVCVPKAIGDEIERLASIDVINKYTGNTRQTSAAATQYSAQMVDNSGSVNLTKTETHDGVRMYTEEKLNEIVSNAAMYKSSLVEECRHELEVRKGSIAFVQQAKDMDFDKLRKIVNNDNLYSEELVYACQTELNIRRNKEAEELAQKEKEDNAERLRKMEEARLLKEKRDEENKLRMQAAWKKWRPAVFAGIGIIAVIFVIIGITSSRQKQEQMRLDKIAYEQVRVENEKQAAVQAEAEAEAETQQRMEEQKHQEEEAAQQKDAAARQAELDRLDSDVTYRHSKGIYRVGDVYENPKGVVFSISNGGKNGKVLSLNAEKSSWENADKEYPQTSSKRLPSVAELNAIYKNRVAINATLAAVGGALLDVETSDYYNDSFYWSYEQDGSANVHFAISMSSGMKRWYNSNGVLWARAVSLF